jgi:hypothetical protein
MSEFVLRQPIRLNGAQIAVEWLGSGECRSRRAIGVMVEDEIIWFWIGSLADCDRLLDTL